MKKIYIIIYLLSISYFNVIGQNFQVSNVITGDNQILLRDLKKVEDGFIAYGIYQGTLNTPDNNSATGVTDLYLAKFNDDFNLVWLKEIEGSGLTIANDFTVIGNDIILLGQFSGTCVFNSGEETLNTIGTDNDIFLAKYKTNGDFTWAKKIAYNNAKQFSMSMDIDINENLIIGGYYQDSITFESEKFISSYGMFYTKIDTSGSLIWAKNIVTDKKQSKLQSVSAFDDGYYLNGNFQGTATFDVKEISNSGLFTDVFIYKTDFNGDGLWIRQTYGEESVKTGTITDDEYGNIYYTGFYNGSQLEMDANNTDISSTVLSNNGSQDIFIFKYNKSGNLIWANNYGTSGAEWARDLKQQNGFLYITGYFSDTLILGSDTLLSGLSGDLDPFLGMIDNDGNTLKGEKLEDSNDGNNSGMELSSDSYNNAYWGGYYKSSSITIGSNVYTNSTGKEHIFFTKYKPPFSVAFTKKQNVSCNKDTDGELIVTPYFGVPPYTYEWSHDVNLNDSVATGLSAGQHYVTVTDFTNQRDSIFYNITEPDSFIFNPDITDVANCSYDQTGAITLNTTGGNGDNEYVWFESEGGSGVQLTQPNQSNLSIGKYCVTVTDSKGCTGDTAIYITGPEPVTFGGSISTPYTGADPVNTGAIDLVMTGGTGDPANYTASWTGPSSYTSTDQDIIGLAPGDYTVTITDEATGGCNFDTTINVLDNDIFYAYISAKKDACNGTSNGMAVVSYYSPDGHDESHISYEWDDPLSQTNDTAVNLAPGFVYHVTVTDNTASVWYEDSVQIDELSYTFSGTWTGTTEVNCKDDSDGYIDLSPKDGVTPYTYAWSNSETTQDITGITAGTYHVTATDANGCSFTLSNYTITEPSDYIIASITKLSSPSCNGELDGELQVDAANGNGAPYFYDWNDPAHQTSQIADGLEAGYYTVTVNDSKGCETTSSFNLTEPDPIVINTEIKTNITCNGLDDGTVTVAATGGTGTKTYTLSPGDIQNVSGLFTDLTEGSYTVEVTDQNNCGPVTSSTFDIVEPDILQITNEEKTDITTCNGDNTGTITITATGGTSTLTYTITPGGTQNDNGIFTGLVAGDYTIEVNDVNSCGPVTLSSITINEPTAISIDTESKTDITCNGLDDGTITISASGGTSPLTYTISPGGTQNNTGIFNGLNADTYTVEVTDANTCGPVISSEFIIAEPSAITIDSESKTDITCNGDNNGSISITASGGNAPLTYTITPGGTQNNTGVFNGLNADTYTVEVTDANSCGPVNSGSLEIIEPDAITIVTATATDASSETSDDGSVTVTATGGISPLTYTLKPQNLMNQTGVFNNLYPNDYTVEITDQNNCGPVISNTITVGFPNAIEDVVYSDKVKLYPNPTSDVIFIEIDYDANDLKLEVLNMSGQVLFKKEINSYDVTKEEVDLSGYSKGVYFIRIYNDQFNYKNRILLQ